MGQEQRHRLGEAVRPDVEDGDQLADVGRRHDRRLAEHVETRTERTGHRDRHDATAAAALPTATAEGADPVLLPDQRRPQDVMDATVEDDDRRAVDGLAVDDASDIGAGRSDEEATGLEEQPGLGQERIRRPGLGDLGEAPARAGPGRATPRAVRTGCRGRRRRRPAGPIVPAATASRRAARTVAATWSTSAATSSTFDAPKACRPSRSRCGDATARRARGGKVVRVHPELASPVVADEPDPLQPGVLGHRRPQQDRLDPARLRRRSPRAWRVRRATRR